MAPVSFIYYLSAIYWIRTFGFVWWTIQMNSKFLTVSQTYFCLIRLNVCGKGLKGATTESKRLTSASSGAWKKSRSFLKFQLRAKNSWSTRPQEIGSADLIGAAMPYFFSA
jgi:hypothetical protein